MMRFSTLYIKIIFNLYMLSNTFYNLTTFAIRKIITISLVYTAIDTPSTIIYVFTYFIYLSNTFY